jgi:glycosyltransferase involved in cell wall biosynthesis
LKESLLRLIGTCTAKNEADIIECFVRHNLKYLDALVVVDHGSTDQTRNVLLSLKAEGMPLIVLGQNEPAFFQGHAQTTLGRQFIKELEADFCFPLDADEFLTAPSREVLEASLMSLPPGTFGRIPWRNYVPSLGGEAISHPLLRVTERAVSKGVPTAKVILSRVFCDSRQLVVSLGNHAVVGINDDGTKWTPPHGACPGITLGHLPVRSGAQLTSKVLIGWLAHRLTAVETPNGTQYPGWHWHEMFNRVIRDGELSYEQAREFAIEFYITKQNGVQEPKMVNDPLPAPPLKYGSHTPLAPLSTLAAWTDQLIEDILRRSTK